MLLTLNWLDKTPSEITKYYEPTSRSPIVIVLYKRSCLFTVPLLDQPVIVEGTRNRKPVIQTQVKIEGSSKSTIEIPHGKGTPLGRIPLINTRLKVRIGGTK